MEKLELTKQQVTFFETFGYLALPGLLNDAVGEITDAFEEIWKHQAEIGSRDHDGTTRTMLVPFIDQHERLCALLDDQRVEGLVESLIGPGFQYVGSDGNYYVGDTAWHSDRMSTTVRFLKVAFYLDSLRRDSGCLRVIPGSHAIDDTYAGALTESIGQLTEAFGVDGPQLPAVALETEPGDVVVFNHRLKHASFGGDTRRRMFTINCCERVPSEHIDVLRDCIAGHVKYGIESMYDEKMLATAGPQRLTHLDQVLANQEHMPALAAEHRSRNPAG